MSTDVWRAADAGGGRDRRRLPGAGEECRGRRGRRERRRCGDGHRGRDESRRGGRHRGERHHAVRADGALPRPDTRRQDDPRNLFHPTEGPGRDVRRDHQSHCGTRGAHRFDAPQGRHGDQARPQHAHDRRDDSARQGLRQSDGRSRSVERKAARSRRADRDGVLWRESRGGARCDQAGGRQCETRDRDGAAQSRRRGGATPARGGRRVRPARRGRSTCRVAMSEALAVGVMSGTSLDGISTALVRLRDGAAELVAFRQEPYSAAERGAIIDTIARGTPKDVAFLHVALGERFAAAVLALLATSKTNPRDLSFIASHGQTIWHEPGRATFQLGDAAVLAERVGVRVVSDFRARDVAAGGQGAPLVPLADVMLFGHEQRGRWLLNIGGMANVTYVPRRGVTAGAFAFDTGPGVAVIDAITRRVDPDATFDQDGERARHGRPVAKLLEELLADPYFGQPPPKSTGRERFGIEYADKLLARVKKAGGSDNDAVATATALTAETIGRAIAQWGGGKDDTAEVVISGGGAKNPALVERLAAKIQPRPVVLFDQLFFNGEAKEAVAFAFLGAQTVRGKAGNLPAATGARGPRILGHITPA